MKVLTEVNGEGLISFLGQHVMVFCANYIYCGTLAGVNTEDIKLVDASIVYETGSFKEANYKDKQELPDGVVYIMKHAIENYGPGKRNHKI